MATTTRWENNIPDVGESSRVESHLNFDIKVLLKIEMNYFILNNKRNSDKHKKHELFSTLYFTYSYTAFFMQERKKSFKNFVRTKLIFKNKLRWW